MTRVAVLSPSDYVHRALRAEARTASDVTIVLTMRSTRELVGLGGVDVIVVEGFADAASGYADRESLLQMIEPVPLVAVGGSDRFPASALERLDGFGQLEEFDAQRVLAAARAAAAGLIVTDRELVSAVRSSSGDPAGTVDPLTERELEVLRLIARGRSNAQIAEVLGLSANTVKFHLSRLFAKLDVGSRSEATWRAIQKGILTV